MEEPLGCCTTRKSSINLILTHSCNKGCSYCFANDMRKSFEGPVQMPLYKVKQLIDWAAGSRFKLLGGEPTQHTAFADIVEYLVRKQEDFTVISNFLFTWSTTIALKHAAKKVGVGFLVNATELDQHDRMTRWKKNYNALKDVADEMTCGITITEDIDYIPYLEWLMSEVSVDRVRISISFPSTNGAPGQVVRNTKLGDRVVDVVNFLNDRGVKVHTDCTMYPCMFKTFPMTMLVGPKALNLPPFKAICSQSVGDVFPDMMVRYCYPNKNLQLPVDFSKTYQSINSMLTAMYRNVMDSMGTPKECEGCDYNGTICRGPCLAFR